MKDLTAASLLGRIMAMAWRDFPNRHGESNHDPERFGPYRGAVAGSSLAKRSRQFFKKLLGVSRCRELYRSLEDESSRQCLVEVLTYRLLGKDKVKLSTNTPAYWQTRADALTLADPTDVITAQSGRWRLPRYRLDSVGYPLSLYATLLGVTTTFMQRHYAYGTTVAPAAGDYVIDAGGCWGDTALFFAHEVSSEGRVYTFEFIPSNLAILKRNLGLNPHLRDLVQVIEAPLWDTSGQVFYCTDEGPSSRLSTRRSTAGEIETTTVTLDSLVAARKIPRVDFIKMDIEGAELAALRGAEATLRRFRPKLAISLYHSLADFWRIPAYLESLDCGYEYHVAHYTIHAEETVLFAIAR